MPNAPNLSPAPAAASPSADDFVLAVAEIEASYRHALATSDDARTAEQRLAWSRSVLAALKAELELHRRGASVAVMVPLNPLYEEVWRRSLLLLPQGAAS